MIYLVAKNKNKHGCYALKTKADQAAVDLINKIDALKLTGLQIVTISRPSAFGEYAPYTFVKNETEFVEKAQNLMV